MGDNLTTRQQRTPSRPRPTEQGQLPDLPSDYGDIQPVADAEEEPPSRIMAPLRPARSRIVLTDPGPRGRINEGIDLASTTDGAAERRLRAGWGANENLRNVHYNEPVSAVTVHHTAGSNNHACGGPGHRSAYPDLPSPTWPAILGITRSSISTAKIYEGRAGGLDRAVQGARRRWLRW